MVGRAIDDKSPDTLVVVSGEGFWTGSSTLPHLHHFFAPAARRQRGSPVETNPRTSLTIALTSRRIGLLGLASVAVILTGMVVTAVPYRGYSGEAYSPLNHFVSELGEVAASRLAWVFNLGIILGGLGLGSFLMLVSRELTGRYRSAFAVAATVAGVSGTLVGVYPMDYLTTHRVVSLAFFLSGWIVAAIFSLWLLTGPKPRFSRLLLAPGGLVVALSLTFIGVYSTYHPASPDARILDRPGVWTVPLLEWASLLSLLLWLACVALVLLRRPSE